jgi:hypothetical protein
MSAPVPDPESTAHEAYPNREYNEAPAPAKSAEEAIRKDRNATQSGKVDPDKTEESPPPDRDAGGE